MNTTEQLTKKKFSLLAESFEWLEALVFSMIFVVVIFTFIFRIVAVDGQSMENTLMNADRLVISNFLYTPKVGDIVVIAKPISITDKPLIKRVIAKSGQRVDINFETGEVSVDGQFLVEPYIKELTHLSGDMKFPLTVPDGQIFVMGDNRNESYDSRNSEVGFVDERYVLGKAIFRFYPSFQYKGIGGK